MRKRTLLTLALTGAIMVCGVGGLYVCMAKTMQEETTIQVKQKEETIFEMTVAIATPATLILKTTTNIRFKTTLTTPANVK